MAGLFAFSILTTDEPEKIVAVRQGPPVVIGLGEDEYFVASDITPVLYHTRDIFFLGDGEMATLTRSGAEVTDFEGNVVTPKVQRITWDPIMAEKGGFKHFMLKEIYEQPRAVRETLQGRVSLDSGKIYLPVDGANIADFWTALEGVSHFSYLMWNAGHDRGVSQLDLELQAEVDKYIASFWLLRSQHPGHRPRELHHLLFACTQVNSRLPPATQHLYAAASGYAARFCAVLQSSLLSNRPALRRRAVAVLRRFYRMGSAGKRRYIEALM
jgi:hypothetical protein